jgi:nitrate/TMAO reductase-like tetraheme cytochrome c subunit
MDNLLVDFWRFLKEHRKALRRAALAVVILLIVAAGVFVRVSESPRFCLSCHIMRPYYDAWATSSHNDVNCLECHYPPTLGGHVASKFRAISQVVQYFTGSYGTRLWAEIPDEACLREGCHDTRLLSGRVTFKKGIAFDHAFHLGEMRRGKRLRCTSCHSQIVVGTHIEVTESVCFTCHFKDTRLGQGTADCLLCHGPPAEVVSYKGLKFDHGDYLAREVPCTKCHMHVVEGNGAVPDTACYRCHGDRSRQVTDPARLHRIHVTDHKVECFECHLEIRHGALELSPMLAPNCGSCHGDMHAAAESIYVGTGGLDTPGVADVMFDAQVTCAGCHVAPSAGALEAPAPGMPRATGESCVACHGAGYDRVLEGWQRDTREAHRKAATLVSAAKRTVYAAGSRDPARASARTLIAQAEKNLELVVRDGSWGAHNVIYANALIETAVVKAVAAAEKTGRKISYAETAFHVPSEEETCAWRCHFGIERVPMTVRGKTFDHGRHLSRAGIECASCHDLERHGVTLSTAYNCSACHHVKGETDCALCHGDVSRLTVSYKGRTFDHGAHAARSRLACGGCHPSERPTVVSGDCSSCHHRPRGKTCEECHPAAAGTLKGTGAPGGPGKASPMAGVACAKCHEQPPAPLEDGGCARCHPAGYTKIYGLWRKGVEGNYRKLSVKVKEARARLPELAGVTVDGRTGKEVLEQAEADLSWAGNDGSWGAHNNSYLNKILSQDAGALELILAEAGD